MTRAIKPPTFEEIPADTDPRLRSLLEQIIYAIDLREGRIAPTSNAAFVTRQEAIDAGVALT